MNVFCFDCCTFGMQHNLFCTIYNASGNKVAVLFEPEGDLPTNFVNLKGLPYQNVCLRFRQDLHGNAMIQDIEITISVQPVSPPKILLRIRPGLNSGKPLNWDLCRKCASPGNSLTDW